jgi:hypothetical protein
MRFCPAKAKAHFQITGLACLVLGARVFRNIETWDSNQQRSVSLDYFLVRNML